MIKTFCAFAGYGGSEWALKQAGIESECIGFSEIDKYAIQCFNQNFPNVKNYGNITEINWSEVPDFDLLTGGFPCTSFSVSGKGLGQYDPRGVGNLGLELTKALQIKQPKWFLFENVKGFMSNRFIETRNMFIKSWEDAGYVVLYKVLNSKDFGIPQNRERVWFVGIRKDIYKPFEFSFPNPEPLKLKLKDILEEEVDEKYYLKQEQVEKLLSSKRHTSPLQNNNYSNTLLARDYKEPKCVVGCALRQRDNHIGSDGREQHLEVNKTECANSLTSVQKDSMIIQLNNPVHSNDRVYSEEGISPTLNTMQGGNRQPFISHSLYPRSSKSGKGGTGHLSKDDGTSYCLDTGDCQGIEYNHQIRKLTPKECFRLMGFFEDEINLEGLSDTQRYRLAGNGWCLHPASDILKRLIR